MYHVRFSGTHYEMGYRFGSALAKHGRYLLQQVPFPVTQERRAFAQSCLPAYEAYFPEILEEIRGLAEGQRCEIEALQAVLLSMYAMPPAGRCSCFAVSDGEHILLGRNSDFLTALEKLNTNFIYQFSNGSYSFTGNTTAFIEIEDGVNEHGLALGLTSVYPAGIGPGLHAGMLLRFFLEKCRTTEEVICQLRRLPVSSAQTITVADARGSTAVLECSAERVNVIRPSQEQPFVCAANFFRSEEMLSSQNLDVDNWQSGRRYATMVQALGRCGGRMDLQGSKDLLAGKTGFLCQYDRASGKDTVWSVIYDLGERAVYRAEGNPGRKQFARDERFPLRWPQGDDIGNASKQERGA